MVTGFTQVRIAGSCDPACAVSIQGRGVRVYPTGAFVGLVPLEEGKNQIEVRATRGGEERVERCMVTCRDQMTTSPVSPVTIDRKLLEPSVHTTLQPGDTLRVRLKGSPGMKAFWSLGTAVKDAPLREEVPAAEGPLQRIAGIYTGSHRVREGDRVRKGRVRFRLVSATGEEASARSTGRVSLLPAMKPERGEAGPEGAVLSDEPGGRRLWALDPGARVTICGEAGDHYRIMMTPRERYWVPRKSVKRRRGKGAWENVSLGMPTLTPAECGARLALPLGGAIPYRVIQDESTMSWALDLFGAVSPPVPAPLEGVAPLARVEFQGMGSGVLRAVLRMADRCWGYAARCGGEGLALELRRGPGNDIGKAVVVIDPGHGGAQDGAVSPTGLKEKDINLKVAQAAAGALTKAGARVVLTREGDATLSLPARVETARREGADIFVSVHHNSRPGNCDPLGRRGSDTFYGLPQSKTLAERILRRIAAAGIPAGECQCENFAVVLPSEYVGVLVECGYMSHPEDEAVMLEGGYPARLGQAIADGVVNCIRERGGRNSWR
jgi:N-acetylmuramoyl-L-alanine amidase